MHRCSVQVAPATLYHGIVRSFIGCRERAILRNENPPYCLPAGVRVLRDVCGVQAVGLGAPEVGWGYMLAWSFSSKLGLGYGPPCEVS